MTAGDLPVRTFTLSVLAARFSLCRLDPDEPAPPDLLAGPFACLTRTPTELSVICEEGQEPAGARRETGWRALAVHGPLSTAEVGVLAALAGALAAAGVPILAISTFDTDWLLVPGAQLDRARQALEAAGHAVLDERGRTR
jgi:hypothetical protein